MNYQLDSIDSGSNYQFSDKMLGAQVSRSAFDWSHLNTLTIPNGGVLVPVMFEEVLPSMSLSMRIKALLRSLPSVVPLYSRQRVYFHAFYSRYSDLWRNAQTYMKKGYNGNEILSKPVLNSENLNSDVFPDGLDTVITADSLFDYFGLPIGKKLSDCGSINALPFMMYASIWKHYFMNKNLYINNRYWLPNDDSDFRLNDNGSIESNITGTSSAEGEPKVFLGELLYRDYPQDYFLSALPFAQRGDTPVLSLTASSVPFDGNISFSEIPVKFIDDKSGSISNQTGSTFGVDNSNSFVSNIQNSNGTFYFFSKRSASLLNGLASVSSDSSPVSGSFNLSGLSFTLDDFRELAIAQSELERMARTDGSYFEFGLTFYGTASRNSIDYRPTYIGGTYQNVVFSEVLQTSSSTESSPLGSYAGHGITSLDGSLGSIDFDDYGYVMVLMSVMPDVYYFQGLSKKFTRLLQSEEFLPGRDKAGLVPILNKEIYVSGDTDVDNDLFAYQNPFDDFRYKANEIHGKIADPSSLSFFPYTQSRRFTETPTYSRELFRADDVRKDYLSAPTEDAYSCQIQFECRVVAPLTYTGSPSPII